MRLTPAAHVRWPPDDVSNGPDITAAANRCSRLLATNSDECAGFDTTERLEDLRNHRPQFLDAVRLREYDDDPDSRSSKVLLKFEILVYREQRVEVLADHEAQEIAIPLRGPPHIDDVANVVSYQVPYQGTGHALIEQQQHEIRSSHGPVQVLLPLARD